SRSSASSPPTSPSRPPPPATPPWCCGRSTSSSSGSPTSTSTARTPSSGPAGATSGAWPCGSRGRDRRPVPHLRRVWPPGPAGQRRTAGGAHDGGPRRPDLHRLRRPLLRGSGPDLGADPGGSAGRGAGRRLVRRLPGWGHRRPRGPPAPRPPRGAHRRRHRLPRRLLAHPRAATGGQPMTAEHTQPPATVYYKFLDPGGRPRWGVGTWHLPDGGRPGKWMPEITGLVPGQRGYHVVAPDQLVDWLGPELFEAECRGEHIAHGNVHVFGEARLVRRIDAWNDQTARLFGADCAARALPAFETCCPGDPRPRRAI